MKTKLNTKTIVAAVASVIGLAVYGYTSMVGYLAASATSTLPVVLTVAALVCLALRQFAGSKLPAVVIEKIASGWPASRWDELMPWNWTAQSAPVSMAA